jgi:hypothetical protein
VCARTDGTIPQDEDWVKRRRPVATKATGHVQAGRRELCKND